MCIDFGILPESDNIYNCENNNISSYLYHHIQYFILAFFSYSLHFHVQLLLDVFSRYLIIQYIVHYPFHHCIFIVPTHLLHFHIHPFLTYCIFTSIHFLFTAFSLFLLTTFSLFLFPHCIFFAVLEAY